MIVLGVLLIFIIGFLVLNLISFYFSWEEKVGLSFPIGIGIQTMVMLLCNMFGVNLNRVIVVAIALFLIILLSILFKIYKGNSVGKVEMSQYSQSKYNFIWLFFIILIFYFEYMNFAKCIFFPTFDRDSLAGFDTIGYIIAQEHTLKDLSIFQSNYMPYIHDAGSYITYAPMVQLSYAFMYILGSETSKLIPALMFLSLLISFYGSMKRVIGKTGAAIATFFMMITPEMIAFSSLSATNVIHATSASLGIIYLTLWHYSKFRKDLYISSLLLGINIWTRTDGIVFILAALSIVFAYSSKNKQWKNVLPLLLSFIPAFLWIIFSRCNNLYADSIAILHPFWDKDKASIILAFVKSHYANTSYYGWSFVFFLVSMIINSWYLIQKKDNLFLLYIIFSATIFYIFLLYHIDYKWDSIQQVMAYSAKRFLFCFIPIVWFYSMSNTCTKNILRQIDIYLSVR